jgi:hypothetical protein
MADSPDHLLEQLQAHFDQPDRPAQDDETSSAFDSELTENENPNEPAPHCPAPKRLKLDTSTPCHFTKSDEFWDSVAKVVTSYMDDAWFSIDDGTLERLGEDWDRNVSAVTTAITGIAREAQLFKIGITEDPKHRWFVCDNGNYSNTFTKMTVVYVATPSKHRQHGENADFQVQDRRKMYE